jgi:hypothetical protein
MYPTASPLRFSIAQRCLAALLLLAPATAQLGRADNDSREPDLSPCPNIQVPEGNVVAFHVYAVGVQIYQWNGSAWVFVAPSARLFADAGYHGQVGTHYAGPTWESNSGSKVLGARQAGCTPDPKSIPWLRLGAVSSQGPGIFHRVSFVQRVNTVGGIAPSSPGSTNGQMAEVPYTAEYYFYRAQN